MDLKDEMESKVVRSFNVNSMPLKYWNAFKESARVNFGDNYALKIIHDHEYVENDKKYDVLFNEVSEIKELLIEVLNSKEENGVKKRIATFGKGGE